LYQWTNKYLATFSSEDCKNVALQEEAAAAVIRAIKLNTTYRFDDLNELAIVKQLDQNPKLKQTSRLLAIFVSESYESFRTFHSQNADFFKTTGSFQS
jgi:hypothetical protein